MRPLPLVLAALLAAAPALHAQHAGRLDGEVTDSLHARPLAGATVLLTRLAAGSSDLYTVVADDRGRFRFDSLATGRYAVSVAHPSLDSLDLVLPPREVDVVDGARTRVALATPSGATLRARACPGLALRAGTGALVGQLDDAEREQPLAGATIALDWSEVTFDRGTMRPAMVPRSASFRTDSTGTFRFCGVPTESYLLLQIQRDQRAGGAVRVSVPEAAGLAVLRLSYSEAASRPLASPADTAGEVPAAPLVGTAALTGVVRAPGGQPIGDASVSVVDAASAARTDGAGVFSLSALPAGTQLLEVRRIGYLVGQQRVELRSGRSAAAEVTLQKIVSLDSVRIIAQRSRYREASERQRRQAGSATYMNEEQIRRIVGSETSDLFTRMAGLRISGRGFDAKLYVSRGAISFSSAPCPMNIVIDGTQHQDVNVVQPTDIGMMEIYKGPAGAPMEYDSACGVVVIWTKR